jgi:creatinine amidohydrolase
MKKVWLSDFTYLEVKELLERERSPVALIPVGATAQHGPHLPLDVDIRIAASMCEAAALATAEDIGVVVAPPFPFGISEFHMAFPGTLSLNAETFISVVYEVGDSLVRHGFDRLVIVNGAGNMGAVGIIAHKLKLDAGASHVIYLHEWDLAREAFAELRESGEGTGSHGCEYETSLYLHLRPELVQMERAAPSMTPQLIEGSSVDMFTPGPYGVALGRDFSESGVMGDPTLATIEKGSELYKRAVQNLESILRELAAADANPAG